MACPGRDKRIIYTGMPASGRCADRQFSSPSAAVPLLPPKPPPRLHPKKIPAFLRKAGFFLSWQLELSVRKYMVKAITARRLIWIGFREERRFGDCFLVWRVVNPPRVSAAVFRQFGKRNAGAWRLRAEAFRVELPRRAAGISWICGTPRQGDCSASKDNPGWNAPIPVHIPCIHSSNFRSWRRTKNS